MTKLLTYYDLCSISDHKEFLGLSEDSELGTVINTLGRNIFLSIQLSNQQQVDSWTVLEKLTNKVVYDFKSSKYVGVFANRYIRSWPKNIKEINKIKKVKIPKQIHDLLTFQRKDTIVLYKDGTCESLESCIESRKHDKSMLPNDKPIIDADSQKIKNVGCFSTLSETTLLTYFAINEKTGDTEFVYFKLDNENLSPSGPVQRFKVERAQQDAKLVGYTVVDGEAYPSLITLWSDKRIFMLPLREDDSKNDAPGYFMAMLSLFKVDQPLAIVGVSKDCVAIYGANDQQEGATLVLYNTRFSVAQSKQFFKVYFNNARIWVIGKYILLAYGQTLACASFRISKEQLADMIGTQRTNDLTNLVDKDCINEEVELEESFTIDIAKQMLSNELASPAVLNYNGDVVGKEWINLNSNNKTIPLENVEAVENDLKMLYNHDMGLEIYRGEVLLSDTVQTKLSNNHQDELFKIDEILLLTSEMEKCGASEFEISEKCVPVLIKANLPGELVTCLRKYTNISEKMLVRSLKFLLGLSHSSVSQRGRFEMSEQQIGYVNVVLSCSFNEDIIKDHLRTLDFDEVLCLMTHIYGLLESVEKTLDEAAQLADNFDEDIQLLNWFMVLLDAHYQQFILSRQAKLPQMLAKWKELIDGHCVALREMKSVSAVLYNLVRGNALTTDKQSSKWYSVEAVKLY